MPLTVQLWSIRRRRHLLTCNFTLHCTNSYTIYATFNTNWFTICATVRIPKLKRYAEIDAIRSFRLEPNDELSRAKWSHESRAIMYFETCILECKCLYSMNSIWQKYVQARQFVLFKIKVTFSVPSIGYIFLALPTIDQLVQLVVYYGMATR